MTCSIQVQPDAVLGFLDDHRIEQIPPHPERDRTRQKAYDEKADDEFGANGVEQFSKLWARASGSNRADHSARSPIASWCLFFPHRTKWVPYRISGRKDTLPPTLGTLPQSSVFIKGPPPA